MDVKFVIDETDKRNKREYFQSAAGTIWFLGGLAGNRPFLEDGDGDERLAIDRDLTFHPTGKFRE